MQNIKQGCYVTRKILIVEDTPTIARVQKHIALKAGYEVDIAESLAATKELIKHNSYFCAVVDFILPDAPAGEAIPYTINADIPTIVMTGNIDKQTRDTVEKYPIIDYIIKENKQAYQYLEKQLSRLPRNENVKVLVVDDSTSTRRYICSLLKRHKYQILEAKDGKDALEVLESQKDVSVIITDNEMPNMNVGIGAIIAELGRQPRFAKAFFEKYQDRILFGKDSWKPEEFPTYFRVLESDDEYFTYHKKYHAFWPMYGLDLSDEVLKKVYYKNALRIVPGLDKSLFPE